MNTYKIVLAGKEFEIVQGVDGKFIIPEALRGIGSALKPAAEIWWLVRKPISEKTVAANVLKHGTGGINIDASRITASDQAKFEKNWDREKLTDIRGGNYNNGTASGVDNKIDAPQGRFPANLIFSHNHDCVEVGTKKVKTGSGGPNERKQEHQTSSMSGTLNLTGQLEVNHRDADGTETVSAFECTAGCPVAELDRQSGVSKSQGGGKKAGVKYGTIMGKVSDKDVGDEGYYGDSGGASRFFATFIYQAKASKKDKNEGLEGMPEKGVRRHGDRAPDVGRQPQVELKEKNFHPTVKSTTLMTYLIKMITPPGGIVLDCFAGSFSTGVSAIKNGFAFIGIEKEEEYFKIGEARINAIEDMIVEPRKSKESA